MIKRKRLLTDDDFMIAKHNLDDFIDFALDNGFRYCIVCGTCLGFIRDKGFIYGDTDVDVALLFDDVNEINQNIRRIIRGLIKKGFEFVKNIGNVSLVFIRNEIELQVFLFWRIDEIKKYSFNYKKHQGIPFECASNIATVECYDDMYCIPYNVEKYLDNYFSRDDVSWKVPKLRGVSEYTYD